MNCPCCRSKTIFITKTLSPDEKSLLYKFYPCMCSVYDSRDIIGSLYEDLIVNVAMATIPSPEYENTQETEMSKLGKRDIDIDLSPITILGIALVFLKLTHVIDWPWLWILSPLWIGAACSAAFLIIFAVKD